MLFLPIRWARGNVSKAALAAFVAPLPMPASNHLFGDPCTPQYKLPSYDRRAFFEIASGFLVPKNRAFPYVATPRVVLLRPLDAAYQWSLSGSVAARVGDDRSAGTIGARLFRSISTSASAIMPRAAIGVGPELVFSHHGGMDLVAEGSFDLTPLMIGVRGSWGPVRLDQEAFSRPARLETFIGWRLSGWRRKSTPLEELMHQPPPPRRRFRPHADSTWAVEFRAGVGALNDPGEYLSLLQQLTIRFGAQFDHVSQDCDRQQTRLKDARKALWSALQHQPGGLTDVRNQTGLENLLREQSESFATTLIESLEYMRQAEGHEPDSLLLAPATLHAMDCALQGTLSRVCIRGRP